MNTYDSNTPIDTLWNEFKTLCNQCLNMIPQKCVTTKVCLSWLTGKIKRLSRRKQRKYNKACLTNNPDNRAAYHKLKKDMQRLCRTSRNNNYVSSLLDPHYKCTKKFWRHIKSMRKEQISINALLFNGETYTDSAAKANILNNQFVSVFTKDDHSTLPIMRGNPIPDIEFLTLSNFPLGSMGYIIY